MARTIPEICQLPEREIVDLRVQRKHGDPPPFRITAVQQIRQQDLTRLVGTSSSDHKVAEFELVGIDPVRPRIHGRVHGSVQVNRAGQDAQPRLEPAHGARGAGN